MDLATEFPIRLQIHHLPENNHLFMFIFHHSVADAERIFAFLQITFPLYHQLVKSEKPPWTATPSLHALTSPQKPIAIKWPLCFKDFVRDTFPYLPSKLAVPSGDGNGTPNRGMLHVEVADKEILSAMKNRV